MGFLVFLRVFLRDFLVIFLIMEDDEAVLVLAVVVVVVRVLPPVPPPPTPQGVSWLRILVLLALTFSFLEFKTISIDLYSLLVLY